MNPNITRWTRNVVLIVGVALFVGGIAWHDVPAGLATLGVLCAFAALSGMVIGRG